MASSKKGKKNKGKTLALVDFLQETPGSVPTIPIRKSALNWADEVEDNHDMYDSRSSKANVILPTAPKASRDFDDIIDKVPQDGPFLAYLTNLPYDVDDNEILYFFKNMKIANMRIPKDERPGEIPKLKGFGYVEFEDRDSLLNALVMPDTTIKNRRIRIEVVSDYDNDKRRMGRMDMSRDRSNRSDISMGDWRSGSRSENTDSDRRGGFGSRDKDRDRDRDRDRDEGSATWRDGGRNNRDSERSFTRSSDRFNRDDRDQDITRSRGMDRDQDFRSREDRPNFSNRRFEDRGSRGGGFSRNTNRDEDSRPSESRQRPKLMLAPRTKPIENTPEPVSTTASIFGNAKPVDTSARERQIEERLAKEGDAPSGRELSKERERDYPDREKEQIYRERRERDYSDREKDNQIYREKKDRDSKDQDHEKKVVDGPKSDANGLADKNHTKKGDHEKKELIKEVADKPKSDIRKKEEKKEKEPPKVKQVDPPNFVASNKFAFLENEDTSD